MRHRVAKNLSGGMKRKLMIAKSLLHDPDYIFLDEPTVGIDVHARKEIWRFLRKYHQSGKTIILTTHYIEEAEQLCDLVLMVNRGQIFKQDTSEHLIETLGQYKIEFEDDMCFFDTLEAANQEAALKKGMYTISKTTLEDVFYHYTQEEYEWKS